MTIADGIAVREVGRTPFELVKNYIDEIVTVSEGEIANAVLLLLETEKTVAEGAAAASLAAVINKKVGLANVQRRARYFRRQHRYEFDFSYH